MIKTFERRICVCMVSNDKNENVQEIRVIKPLTKVLHKSFCCTHACHELHFRVKEKEARIDRLNWGWSI